MIISRRLAVGAFASVGAALVLTGTALACVPFKGTAKVDSSNTGSVDSGTVIGNGTTANMRYCGDTVSPGSTTVTAAENKGGDVITVTVGAATCSSGNSQLAQGSHTVIVNNATVTADAPFSITGTTKSIVQGKGCFTSPNPNGNKTLGSLSVNGSGNATATFTLPTMNSMDGASRISALCVGRPGAADEGGQGIFVPIKITATTGGGS